MSEKRDRLKAALAMEYTDRPPISMWRHFYDQETSSDGLAKSMLEFQRLHNWDFMKVNPRAQYHVEDWGATFQYTSDPYTGPTPIHVPITTAADWQKLEPLDPYQGALGEHIQALRIIKQGLDEDVPFVMTVFNPISIAGRLVKSQDVFLNHMEEWPSLVHNALNIITESYKEFVTACLNEGVDGIFFATTSWASHAILTDAQYQEFGRPYDIRVMESATEAEFNILHVCHSHNMLENLANYPGVHALNWDATDHTNPSLEDAQRFTKVPLLGGISRTTLLNGTPQDVIAEIRAAVAQAEGAAFILGPGCSISPQCPESNLQALKQALHI